MVIRPRIIIVKVPIPILLVADRVLLLTYTSIKQINKARISKEVKLISSKLVASG